MKKDDGTKMSIAKKMCREKDERKTAKRKTIMK